MHRYGLRAADLDILYYISVLGKNNLAKNIVDIGRMSKGNISKSVENLREKKYILLSEDLTDHRCIHINITPSGMPIIHELHLIREEISNVLLVGISKEDKRIVLGIMKQIETNLDREIKKVV